MIDIAGRKKYKCKYCDFRASSKKNRRTHMKSKIHIKDLSEDEVAKNFRFHCDICDYKTYRNPVLKKHMNTHLKHKIDLLIDNW